MPLPEPAPGLVIRYAYLWASEHRRGREEGVKDRPCAIILAVTEDSGARVVTVLPITHSPPSDPALAVPVPHETKRRLGLDDAASWVVLSEANRFIWPGPDLRLGPAGGAASVAYGLLPRGLFHVIRDRFSGLIETALPDVISRTH